MNKVLVISYATKNTPYEEIFEQYLRPTLSQYKLDYFLAIIENEKSWIMNTAQKPKVLLDVMKKNKFNYDTFVYLDADSKILQYPELFFTLDKNIDLCYHKLEWDSWYGRSNSGIKELLTGTLILRYNNKIVNLLQEWYHESMCTKIWEQKVLESILPKHNLNIQELSLEYCHISSRPGNLPPLIKCNPIVEHYQKSRELKKLIK